MRVSKKIGHKERRRFALDSFGGVDFGSSPLLCDPHRSTDAVNFIGDHGINRKRHGWEQVEYFSEKIVCIAQVADDTVIVVTDSSLMKLVEEKPKGWNLDYTKKHGVTVSDKVTAVHFNGRLFFIGCGAWYYDFSSTEFSQITADDYYIPTTTIDIDPVGVADKRATKDMPNLLTNFRINNITGGEEDSIWHLDAAVSLISYREEVVLIEVTIKRDQNTIIGICDEYKENDFAQIWESEEITEIGYIATDTPKEGMSELLLEIPTVLSGVSNNISVKFPAKSQLINPYRGNIGTTFGINGANDRLFVAGHPDHPNVIFFSEIDDPTYFPDQYTISVGSSNSKIVGLLRLSDTTMAVFKEPSANDVSLYYIRGRYESIYNDDGSIKKTLPVFSISAEGFYDAPVNAHACLNFHGDSMFVSKNGVYGIEAQQNISADIRVARDRGLAISSRLSSKDLSNAVAIAHGSRCYISDGYGGCYVADAAYKYVPDGALSYNYEWWYWDNVPARVFAIVNDEVWFGTEDKRICRFSDGYMDVKWNIFDSGMVTIYDANGNEEIDEEEEGVFQYVEKSEDSIWENRRVRILNMVKIGNAEIPIDLSYKDLFIYDIDTKKNTFKLSEFPVTRDKDGKLIEDEYKFIPIKESYFGIYKNIRMVAYIQNPVKSYWSTPPLDFGNDSMSKSLYSMTVTAESGTNAKFKFGYETRGGSMERNMEGTGVFDFNNFDFADFSFENGFQNSFTVRARERNFNFIRFHVLSDEDAPCAVHRISAEYKYNKKNRGVV